MAHKMLRLAIRMWLRALCSNRVQASLNWARVLLHWTHSIWTLNSDFPWIPRWFFHCLQFTRANFPLKLKTNVFKLQRTLDSLKTEHWTLNNKVLSALCIVCVGVLKNSAFKSKAKAQQQYFQHTIGKCWRTFFVFFVFSVIAGKNKESLVFRIRQPVAIKHQPHPFQTRC